MQSIDVASCEHRGGAGVGHAVTFHAEKATPSYLSKTAIIGNIDYEPPVLESVSPSNLLLPSSDLGNNPRGSGSTINLLGKHFGDPGLGWPVEVVVGDRLCLAVQHLSDESLRCVMPDVLGSAEVRVSVGGQRSVASVNVSMVQPQVSSISEPRMLPSSRRAND